MQMSDASPAQAAPPPPTDFLQSAIDRVKPGPNDPPPSRLPEVPSTAGGGRPEISADRFDANSAQNKMIQEALLTHPDEMRRIFRSTLKDASINGTSHLNFREIVQGSENPSIPDNERNLLTVLKNGYDKLRIDGSGSRDPYGVSDDSLSVIEKALNRKVENDPIWNYNLNLDLKKGPFLGGISGVAISQNADIKTGLMITGATAAAVTVGLEIWDFWQHSSGGYNKKYDKIEKDYMDYVSGVKAANASKAQASQ